MNKKLLVIALLNLGFLNAQIENGMVAHFPFNGNVNDISSSSIVATNAGATYGPDRISTNNNAISLGTNKYISFSNNAVKSSLPLTISTWVKFNSFSELNSIFTSDNEYNNYHGYWFHTVPGTGQVAFSFGAGLGGSNSSNRRTFVTNTALTEGVWYNVIAVIRAHNNMEIYFGCEKQTGTYSGTGSTTMVFSATESRIGSSPGQSTQQAGWYCDGSIDQLAIWNRAINSSEIEYLCDIRNTLSIADNQMDKAPRELVKIINVLGQEVKEAKNTPLIYIYNDGSTERIIITE